MVYENEIFALIGNECLNYSRGATAFGGDSNIYSQTLSYVEMGLPKSGIIKGFKSWLRLNQYANNTYFYVRVNGVAEYSLYYATSVTGLLEDFGTDFVCSAGDDISLYHTEDAFTGAYEGYMNMIGVYD